MPWSRSNWPAISNPSAIQRMPAGGISPPPKDSAVPTGRPRRRKAPHGLAPPNPRKFRSPSASRPKNRLSVNRVNQPNPNRKASRLSPRQHPRNPKLKPLPSGVPPHPIGVPGTGVEGAATIRTVLLVARTLPRVSVNHARLGLHEATHRRHPPRKNHRLLRSVLHAHCPRNPPKFPRRAFAAATVIPAWPRALRNSK